MFQQKPQYSQTREPENVDWLLHGASQKDNKLKATIRITFSKISY